MKKLDEVNMEKRVAFEVSVIKMELVEDEQKTGSITDRSVEPSK